jgi:hypothetical protein
MAVVIDHEFLKGNQNNDVIKELTLSADNVIQTFHFHSPYASNLTVPPKSGSVGMTITSLSSITLSPRQSCGEIRTSVLL